MDDLSGLDWSSKAANSKPPPMNSNSSFYPPLRPTPSPLGSGRNTPLSAQGSGNPSSKSALSKPAQDSFSNLVNFGSQRSNAHLSLREQQERLELEKRRKEEERRKQTQTQYGDGHFLDSLGQSRTASPAISPPVSGTPNTQNGSGETNHDLFAAFNASTKVDKSSYYPPSSGKASPTIAPGLNLGSASAWNLPATSNNSGFGDDDDPFGLNEFKSGTTSAPSAPPPATGGEEDDDLLGDLGKPVDQVRRKAQAQAPKFAQEPEPGKAIEDSSSESEVERTPPSDDPFDKAVAQLVDYGFTPENARRGLTESGAGLNVQAAANWLLDDAHRQAKEKVSGKRTGADQIRSEESRASSRSRTGSPAWMQDGSLSDGSSRRDNRSPGIGDNDFSKTASSMGTSFFKTANTLWKTGQKKVQKALDDFQQEGGDPNQPKWMRDAQQDRWPGEARKQAPNATEEALMLESGARPGRRQESAQPRSQEQHQLPPRAPPAQSRASPVPRWQQSGQAAPLDPRTRINKQALEEQSAQAYISPARRKKTPQPSLEVQPKQVPEADLLSNSQAPSRPSSTLPSRPAQRSPANGTPSSRQSPIPRPTPTARPPRQVPQVSAIALKSSTQHRVAGTAHFKRGDYASAHASYSSSLAAIPKEHPLAIILLCNRALTALKTGEPRQAVDDADNALGLIGPGKGEGEHVELHDNENEKRDMRELYGKALTRKAEALEQMEKWAEAGSVWQLCIESGVGGPTATAGRQRCQKALAPKPPPAARSAPARPRPRPIPSGDSEAVKRLRAANAAADQEGSEKFALADKVDARIAAWRDGKRDNLRALLSSLDNVLWENSGWKKVGLHELVMANKVKIIYMKAIAKTHPDKIAQDASTEVRMIAGTVFATLNEAWDKFKAENGL